MKSIVIAISALFFSLGVSAQQDHYYQIFSIGECNHEGLEVNLIPLFQDTPDVLVLSMEPFEANVYQYHLFNMHGVAMRSGKVVYNESEIVMTDYPEGSYHLLITTEEEDIQLFRIKKKALDQ